MGGGGYCVDEHCGDVNCGGLGSMVLWDCGRDVEFYVEGAVFLWSPCAKIHDFLRGKRERQTWWHFEGRSVWNTLQFLYLCPGGHSWTLFNSRLNPKGSVFFQTWAPMLGF